MSTAEWAAAYAARLKWRVFPVHRPLRDGRCTCGHVDCGRPGKHPACRHGVDDASADATDVASWGWAWRNIGVAAGDRFWVLDVDGAEGMAAFTELRGTEIVPPTVTARTGGGGWHLLFAPDTRVRNRVRVAPGIDIRATGGYILVAPSMHASGQRYTWEVPPGRAPIATAPDWLLARVVPRDDPPRATASPGPHEAPQTGRRAERYAQAALAAACDRVSEAVKGGRNHTLNREALSIARLVAGGVADDGQAWDALTAAGLACGLGAHEVHATLASAWRAGSRSPRTLPEPR